MYPDHPTEIEADVLRGKRVGISSLDPTLVAFYHLRYPDFYLHAFLAQSQLTTTRGCVDQCLLFSKIQIPMFI